MQIAEIKDVIGYDATVEFIPHRDIIRQRLKDKTLWLTQLSGLDYVILSDYGHSERSEESLGE